MFCVHDRGLTIHKVAAEPDIANSRCYVILTQYVRGRRVSEKFFLQILTEDQKECHITTYCELFQHIKNYQTFLSSIITGDKN
jgi:hypothetical protein